MTKPPDNRKLYFYLERHEGAMARMYRYFAKAFPEHADFWLEIARQETRHARWVMSLQHRPDDEVVSLTGVHFNLKKIQESISKIERYTHDCLKGKLDLQRALEIALGFEESALEKEFFVLFKFRGEKGREIQRLIERETDDHRSRIAGLLAQVKRG